MSKKDRVAKMEKEEHSLQREAASKCTQCDYLQRPS